MWHWRPACDFAEGADKHQTRDHRLIQSQENCFAATVAQGDTRPPEE